MFQHKLKMQVFLVLLSFLLCNASAFFARKLSNSFDTKQCLSSRTIETGNGSPDAALKAGIANFYDQTSGIWLDVWGEDMHHGYYPHPNFRNHKAAQLLMIEQALKFGFNVPSNQNLSMGFFDGKKMVDVGCGVGGSSRYIVKNFGGSATGLSLSPFQIGRANDYSAKAGLAERLSYQMADAMKMPFADNSFDLTWSMESGEHMPDKEQFMQELYRVTKPGGRIIVVTWCHRDTTTSPLSTKEAKLLQRISKAYFLPAWVSAKTYVDLARKLGMQDVREDDWSEFVAPFWPAVIRSALQPKNFVKMLLSGWTTVQGAIASWWMRRGLKKGVIKFAIITGRK
eukprot:gene29792-35971_t